MCPIAGQLVTPKGRELALQRHHVQSPGVVSVDLLQRVRHPTKKTNAVLKTGTVPSSTHIVRAPRLQPHHRVLPHVCSVASGAKVAWCLHKGGQITPSSSQLLKGQRPLELQKFSDTRWTCRGNALKTIRKVLPAAMQYLEDLRKCEPPDLAAGDAKILLRSINFKFLLSLDYNTSFPGNINGFQHSPTERPRPGSCILLLMVS